jgi:hypothetical protein
MTVVRLSKQDFRRTVMINNNQNSCTKLGLIVSSVVCLAACQAPETTQAPTTAIVSHDSGEHVFEGALVTFVGTAADVDTENTQLTAHWERDGETLCASAPLSAKGETVCTVQVMPEDHTLSLTVSDGEHEATDEIDLTVIASFAPNVLILSPTSSDVHYVDQPVTLRGLASDTEDEPQSLVLSWTSDLDGVLVEGQASDLFGELTADVFLSQGAHTITFRADDTMGKSAVDSVAVNVGPANSAPTCGISLPVSGDFVGAGTVVNFSANIADVDIGASALSVEWYSDVDGIINTAAANSSGIASFNTSSLSVGNHSVLLTVRDEVGAICTDQTMLTVNSSPNVMITLPILGDVYHEGDAVTIQGTVNDQDQTAGSLTLNWFSDIDGSLSSASASPKGMTGFESTTLSPGTHQLTLTAVDAIGASASTSVDFRINRYPTLDNLVISQITGVTVESVINCMAVGSDTEDGNITPTYEWSNATTGDLLVSSSNLALNNSMVSADDEVVCTATVIDSDGASATLSNSVVIINTAPSVDLVTILPEEPYATSDITCTYEGFNDADGDADLSRRAWFVNGIFSGTAEILGASAVYGDVVECVVSPFDGTDYGIDVSATTTILNTAPTLTSATITPNPATTDDDLFCMLGTTTDVDGDTVTYTYEWMIDEVVMAETSATLSSLETVSANVVVCKVTPNDGTVDGDVVESVPVTIGNTVPEIGTVTLTPTPATIDDELFCEVTDVIDADGDDVSLEYSWRVNGSVVAESVDTLSGLFAGGDIVRCIVTPNDGLDNGTSLSATVTIENTLPTIDTVTINPDPAYVGDILVCSYDGFEDRDGDSDQSTYAWYMNGILEGITDTMTLARTNGDVVECIVTPHDGFEAGTPVSASMTIANTLPILADVALTPEAPLSSDTLTCIPGATTDVDEGSVFTYSYAWTVNGTSIAATSNTLTGADFSRDDVVACLVTPNDGYDDGAQVVSNSVQVENTVPMVENVQVGPSPAYVTDVLSCTYDFIDIDTDADESVVSWYVNGSFDSNGSTFSGAVKGDTVTCQVEPRDSESVGAVVSADVVISNTPPTAPIVSLNPASPLLDNETLSCQIDTPSTDADGDGVAYDIHWYLNGVEVVDAISTTYITNDTVTFTGALEGDAWECEVTPNDGDEDGAIASAAADIGCQSLSFDGIDDVLVLDGGVPADLVATDATKMIGGWYNTNGSAAEGTILSLGTDEGDCGDVTCGGGRLELRLDGGYLVIGTAQGSLSTITTIPMDSWVYLYGGFDLASGGYFVGFVDDGDVTEVVGDAGAVSTNFLTAGEPAQIGVSVIGDYLSGTLSEVAIWTTRPSEADLLTVTSAPMTGVEPDLFAVWRLMYDDYNTDYIAGWYAEVFGASATAVCF